MMAEGKVERTLPRRHRLRVVREEGVTDMPYPRIGPGSDARYEIDRAGLEHVTPMIAKPFSRQCVSAEEVARERIPFDKALIGRVPTAATDDLLQAALVSSTPERRAHEDHARVRRVSGLRRSGNADRTARPAPRRGVDRQRLPLDRRRDSSILVRPLLWPGSGRVAGWPARDHVVQPQLAEPHGLRRRRLPGQPRDCRRLGPSGVHGAAVGVGVGVGPKRWN